MPYLKEGGEREGGGGEERERQVNEACVDMMRVHVCTKTNKLALDSNATCIVFNEVHKHFILPSVVVCMCA